MKAPGLAISLGSAFVADLNNINDGYPILTWQQVILQPPVGAPGSGDIDGDGEVTMYEVLIATRTAVGTGPVLTPAQLAAIDMDFDGEFTMADVIMIMRKAIA